MRTLALASLAVIAASSATWLACSSSNNTTPPPAGGNDAGADAASAFVPALGCTDPIDSVYADPGALPANAGDVIKCAHEKDVSAADLEAAAKANLSGDTNATNTGYDGKPFTSGAHEYRILYRTERGDANKSAGYSSAKVFIPDTPRAASLPVIVGARGSRGQAARCAASQEAQSDGMKGINGDYEALSYPLVGAGYAVIVPDLAGYAAPFEDPKNPISGYAAAADVGKGTLDGARALAKLLPSAFNGKVVIVGHSQGGHSALASLALQPSYAPELQLAGVVTYSPLWIAQRSWGALFFEASSYPITGSEAPNAVAIWYHYTHSALLDGPDHALDLFAADKKDAVKKFVENDCWGEWDDLHALGTTSKDVFDQGFQTSITTAAALGHSCSAGDTVCTTWMQRYADDRPHLSTNVPILIEYGSSDVTIPPPQMACVIDRLKNQDHVGYSFCLNEGYGHTGVVRHTSSYVADWIAAQTLGGPAPAACAETDANLTDDAGTPIKCGTPPPNQ